MRSHRYTKDALSYSLRRRVCWLASCRMLHRSRTKRSRGSVLSCRLLMGRSRLWSVISISNQDSTVNLKFKMTNRRLRTGSKRLRLSSRNCVELSANALVLNWTWRTSTRPCRWSWTCCKTHTMISRPTLVSTSRNSVISRTKRWKCEVSSRLSFKNVLMSWGATSRLVSQKRRWLTHTASLRTSSTRWTGTWRSRWRTWLRGSSSAKTKWVKDSVPSSSRSTSFKNWSNTLKSKIEILHPSASRSPTYKSRISATIQTSRSFAKNTNVWRTMYLNCRI